MIMKKVNKTAVVLAAAMMFCGTASVLPDTGMLTPANEITASAASYSYGSSISKGINTYYRVLQWPFANSTANHANYISSSFNERIAARNYAPHGAIDIAATAGTPVRTVAPGKVVLSAPDNGTGWGNHVIVQHTINNKTFYSQYSHLQTRYVSNGQQITSNTNIGTVGGSGSSGPNTYGAHLDLQISINNPANLSGGYQREALTLDPLKVLQLPSSLVVAASSNPNEVGQYIYDRMNVDRCPEQLKNAEVNLQHERTLTCRLSPHKVGTRDGDAYFARVSHGQGYMVYGPYETYSTGNKTVKFRMKIDCNGEDYYRRFNSNSCIDDVVCAIDVNDATTGKKIKTVDIKRSDFLYSNVYQDFGIDFHNQYSNHKLEFRIYYKAKAALWADTVKLYKRNG